MKRVRTNSGRGYCPAVSSTHAATGLGSTGLMLMLASMSQSTVAVAQQPQSATGLEEVTVTARRREESAQSVPIAITAISGEQIDNLQLDTLENLQTVVPELSVSASSGRPNSPVYGLRGIRPTESIYGQDPTVAVYFADFVLSPGQGSNLGIFDLSSIQVLKGPQGTLFGRNTTGGAILFGPRRPGDEFAGDAMIGFGNFGRTEAQLGLDLPASENLALRLVGRMVQSDGYQTNRAVGPLYGSKLGGEDTRNLRLSAVWDITDSIENYTVLSWDDKESNGRGMTLEAVRPGSAASSYNGSSPGLPSIWDAFTRAQGRDVTDIESDQPQYDEIRVWSLINTTTAELSDDLTLKAIAGYRDFETFSTINLDSTQIPGLLTAGSNVPGVLTAPEQHVTLDHASLEVQLLGTALDERLNWVTGVYAYQEEGFEFSPGDVLLALSPATNPFAQRGDVDNTSYSGFAQGTFSLTPKWAITAGARWTYDKKEMTVSSKNGATCAVQDPNTGVALPANACALTLSDSFDQPTGTVSLDFKATDSVLLYVASRYGYRSGGFNLRAIRPAEYAPFQPETVIDVELGAKTDWFIGPVRMRTNVAAYQQWYDDIQRTVAFTNAVGVPGSRVENAAKATVLGVELEQTIAPTDNLTLQINYAYTDPQYDEWFETIPNPGFVAAQPESPTNPRTLQRDLSQTPFHFTPEHAGSAQLTYIVPLDAAGDLRFSAGGSFRDGVWINSLGNIVAIQATPASVIPALRQEAYWLYDVGAGWTNVLGSGLDLSTYVKNVTDEEYTLGGIQLYTTIGISTKAYGEPRTYGMELRYKF
jgi:iron complex outermembrane receptor protein